jgi:hypothetical protein
MEGLVASIMSIYSSKLEEDIRTPSYTFSVPGVDGSFGVVGGLLAFWIHIATVR